MVKTVEPHFARVERLIGQRAAEITFRRLDLLAHERGLAGVGLLLEVLTEMINGRDRIFDVLFVNETGFEVRLRRGLAAPRDHAQKRRQCLLRPALFHQLLPFAVRRVIRLCAQAQAFAGTTACARQPKGQHY